MNSEYLLRFEEFLNISPPEVSFEFFPPKSNAMERNLWNTIKAIEPLNPKFVSVTYGAGGSTRERTHQTVKRILDETALIPAAHLTCVDATRDEIDEIARRYWESGIRHIVALRGDSPESDGIYKPYPNGYAFGCDLVKGLRRIADFEISVAAYPEAHPQAVSLEEDIEHLKEKVDAGASRVITQYCFNTDLYLSFIEKVRKVGITIPIVPGIILISNFEQLKNFSKMCGTTIPTWIYNLLDGTDENPELRDNISAMIAAEQCRILRNAGIERFHFYTLNRPSLVMAVCRILGVKRL